MAGHGGWFRAGCAQVLPRTARWSRHILTGAGACAWTCALHSWSLLVPTHPTRSNFQPQPPTRGSDKTAPNYMKLIQPTTGYLFSLATLRQAFQPGGEEFDAKPKLKPKSPKLRGSGTELWIPAACGAPGSPAPVLGYTVWGLSQGEGAPGGGNKCVWSWKLKEVECFL